MTLFLDLVKLFTFCQYEILLQLLSLDHALPSSHASMPPLDHTSSSIRGLTPLHMLMRQDILRRVHGHSDNL